MQKLSGMPRKIRELRKALRLTQAQLGELLGVSKTAVSDWERGAYLPERENLIALSKNLGTSTSYLTSETDDPRPPTHLQGGVRSPWNAEASENEHNQSNVEPYNLSHMIRIKVLDTMYAVCCGVGIDWGAEAIEYSEVLDLPIPELAQRYSDGDLIGARVDGDSMEPRIHHGDLVLFAPHETEIIYAGIMMVVSYNNKMMIRGVIMNNKKKVILKAINRAEYGDVTVTPDDDFDICGRVVKIFSVRDPGALL